MGSSEQYSKTNKYKQKTTEKYLRKKISPKFGNLKIPVISSTRSCDQNTDRPV
jgi:hypothetical protein